MWNSGVFAIFKYQRVVQQIGRENSRTRYAIEGRLHLLAQSRHADSFVLCGAMLLMTWFDFGSQGAPKEQIRRTPRAWCWAPPMAVDAISDLTSVPVAPRLRFPDTVPDTGNVEKEPVEKQ